MMQDQEKIIWNGAVLKAELIASRSFDILSDCKVLELGSLAGFFTKQILHKTNNITVIDVDNQSLQYVRKNYPAIESVESDMHEFVKIPQYYDAVVIYGVLYHSPSPLSILEDIANNIKPKYMLLESLWQGYDDKLVAVADEPVNQTGYRWTNKKHCGVALNISQILLEQVMNNLGYKMINKFSTADIPGYTDIITNFKPGSTWCYSNWQIA